MNVILVVVTAVLYTSVPVAYLQEQDDTPLMLLFNREQESNIILFRCRDSVTSNTISDASYFLNGSRINDKGILTSDGRLSIAINRDSEGVYSCGNETTRSLSNNISFIAFPDRRIIPSQPPKYAVIGDRVQIDCGILPGKLLQQYSINWYKSTRLIVEGSIPMELEDGRYAVNSSTLSLIINPVTESDSSAHYRCDLIVRDPEVEQTYRYQNLQLKQNFVTLIVLGYFRLQVDVTQEGDVFFEVTVPEPLLEPVRLQINYTNTVNSRNHIINTTSAYLGNSSFLHREYRSQVPFDEFQVGVRLLSLDRSRNQPDTVGPLIQDPTDYAKDRSTICNSTAETLGIIVGGGVGGGIGCALFVLVIFISTLVFSLVCYRAVKRSRLEETREANKHERELKERELNEKVVNEPDEIATEFLKQICDKENSDAVRIAMIEALAKLKLRLTPVHAADETAMGTPDTSQEATANASPEPQTSPLINNNGSLTVAIPMEQIQRTKHDGDGALAGPPPPPPTYEQSKSHPVVIIREQESPEVLKALEAFCLSETDAA